MKSMLRPGAVLVVLLAAIAQEAQPAHALPPVPAIERVRVAVPAKRCASGYRKSTVTGKCVRIQPRWPILSWFD